MATLKYLGRPSMQDCNSPHPHVPTTLNSQPKSEIPFKNLHNILWVEHKKEKRKGKTIPSVGVWMNYNSSGTGWKGGNRCGSWRLDSRRACSPRAAPPSARWCVGSSRHHGLPRSQFTSTRHKLLSAGLVQTVNWKFLPVCIFSCTGRSCCIWLKASDGAILRNCRRSEGSTELLYNRISLRAQIRRG